jgi:hypothetical protein
MVVGIRNLSPQLKYSDRDWGSEMGMKQRLRSKYSNHRNSFFIFIMDEILPSTIFVKHCTELRLQSYEVYERFELSLFLSQMDQRESTLFLIYL